MNFQGTWANDASQIAALALALLATAIAVQPPSLGLLVGRAEQGPNIFLLNASGTLAQTNDITWSLANWGPRSRTS